ncbi:glycosyltransferase [Nocardioides sp. R1-1]|uniref:glycosyltransferase n=1 Tax=Nocardioides sp. R1-1 TaxID=3383502 RepID=UPI0038D19ADC
MRLLVATEARLLRAPDGRVVADAVHTRAFFDRYLGTFDEVVVLARVQDAPPGHPAPADREVEDERVRVAALPPYTGLGGLAQSWRAVRREAVEALSTCDAAVLRAPGQVAGIVHSVLDATPFAVEVLGDPAEVFAPGTTVRHPGRPLIRRHAVRSLETLCRRATAVGYVSDLVLPQRYPAAPGAPVATYSDVHLPPEAFRPPAASRGPVRRLVTVTALDQPYKGIDVLLRAMSHLGSDVTLSVVGGGRLLADLDRLAGDLGLGERVRFVGQLTGAAAVRAALDGADAFVLPSLTEGLPRALIEAMARGLPCVGTDVGGIPELLPAEALCRPGDEHALARLVGRLTAEPAFASTLAEATYARSRSYALPVLQHERERILGALRRRALATTRSTAR